MLAKALSITPDSLKVDVRIFVTGSDVPDLGYELPEATPSTSSVGCAQTPVSEKAPKTIAFGNQCDDLIENFPSLSSLAPFRSVTMMQGRPSLATLLQGEAEETRGGSMWVTGEDSSAIRIILLIYSTSI